MVLLKLQSMQFCIYIVNIVKVIQYYTNYCAAHTLNQYIANYIIGGNSDHMTDGYHIFGGILDQDQHTLKI